MKNNVNLFLKNLLITSSRNPMSIDDTKNQENQVINDFIYSKLTNKKFRKFKMHQECIERTKHAISVRVANNEPIHIVFPQGGYKLWRLPSSPTVDWAEFFNISYLLSYIAPIAANYKPGIQLTYFMHTLLMELHDNLTTAEINEYIVSFEKLINEFRKYLPGNITISILKDTDLYTREEYFTALEVGKNEAEKDYKTWSIERKERFAKMANLNIKWKGRKDWTKLTKEKKEEKIYLAALYESAAVSQLKRIAEKVKSSENVLVFTSASPAFIGIGSTKASIAKYWVGIGVLQKKEETFLPIILTPSQYETALKNNFERIPVHISDHANFQEILVFNTPFDFSRSK